MSTPAVRGRSSPLLTGGAHFHLKLQRKSTFHFAEKGRWASPGCHHQPVAPSLTCPFAHTEEDLPGGAHTSSQAKLQWQKVLSSPNLWTDLTLILH